MSTVNERRIEELARERTLPAGELAALLATLTDGEAELLYARAR